MSLRVVIGRANAGKTGWILRRAFEALDLREPVTLVVPNLADVRRLQTELAGKAPFRVRVATSQTLAEDLWQLYGDGRRLVGEATRIAIAKQLLKGPLGEEVASSARTPGFERLLVQAARGCGSSPHREKARIGQARSLVLDLLDQYRQTLGTLGLIEPGWIASLLAENPPCVGFLGFMRFTGFSDADMAMIRVLAAKNSVCAALTWEEGFPPTIGNSAVAAMLVELADEVRIAADVVGDPELECVSTRSRPEGGALAAGGSVVLGEAVGREAEAALVASLAARAVRNGTPPERIAVTFGQLGPRLHLIRNAMRAEHLECDFDCPLSVGASPLGRAITALLRIALGIGGRTDALQFLQGPFSDTEADDVLAMDNRWRRGHKADDCRQIQSDIEKIGGNSGIAARLCREAAGMPLNAFAADKWQELADGLISTASMKGSTELPEVDASAHRSFTGAIAEMASVEGHVFSAAEMLSILPTLSCSISSEEAEGRVQVIQASRLGARRFDELIIAGVTEAEFPRGGQDTFAAEVQALSAGTCGVSDAVSADLGFYQMITRPRRRLSLVRQTVSSDGVVMRPSPLLSRVLDLYRRPDESESDALRERGRPETILCQDARWFAPAFTEGRREKRRLPEDSLPPVRTVVHGRLDPRRSAKLTQDRVYSATEIEAYLRCPYSWFYTRVVRPREIDAVLDAGSLGSRAHRLISDFYDDMKREGISRVTPDNLSACLALFNRSSERSTCEMIPVQGLAEEVDAGRALSWARHVVEDDAYVLTGYVPGGHEITFGTDPVFEFAGVPIAGRIDRVDIGPRGVVVTDYKSTRDVAGLTRPGAGIQHLLYGVAAAAALDRPVVGSVYRSLRSRQMRGFWRGDLEGGVPSDACDKDVIDGTRFSKMVGELEDEVRRAVDGMVAGDIGRVPRNAQSCRYCALAAVCEGALR